ncbi:winged helix-turn-helix domain-containing protein [Leucobacter sp. HY1908]
MREDEEGHEGDLGHKEHRSHKKHRTHTKHRPHKEHEATGGGLYLDEAGEHPPDYSEPVSYDEKRWGGPHRDVTSGGIPTMSVCRVLALRLVAEQPRSSGEIRAAIADDLALGDRAVAQRTRTGDNRFTIRVRWALATLRRAGYIGVSNRGDRGAPRVPKRGVSSRVYEITPKGKALLTRDPQHIDESGAEST